MYVVNLSFLGIGWFSVKDSEPAVFGMVWDGIIKGIQDFRIL